MCISRNLDEEKARRWWCWAAISLRPVRGSTKAIVGEVNLGQSAAMDIVEVLFLLS